MVDGVETNHLTRICQDMLGKHINSTWQAWAGPTTWMPGPTRYAATWMGQTQELSNVCDTGSMSGFLAPRSSNTALCKMPIYIYGNPPTRAYLELFFVVFAAEKHLFYCPVSCVICTLPQVRYSLIPVFLQFLNCHVVTPHPKTPRLPSLQSFQ